MATIVLVHGIAQEQRGAELIANNEIAALVSGIENAAQDLPHSERTQLEALARRIRARASEVGVAVAFYGAAFLKPRTDDDNEKRFRDDLALAMMVRARDNSSRKSTRDTAARQIQEIEASGEAQGKGRVLGAVIKRLSRIPGIADWVMGGIACLVPTLGQVSQYMRDPKIRDYARGEVRRLITPDTRVLIGHSLGSVVAYDVARELNRPLPLLLTLGSPLGLKKIIYDRIDPQPPTFPAAVSHWVNVADPEDFIASTLDLRPDFSEAMPPNARFDNIVNANNGADAHKLTRYLAKKTVGSAVLQAMMPLI